jgi:hypothetical protein
VNSLWLTQVVVTHNVCVVLHFVVAFFCSGETINEIITCVQEVHNLYPTVDTIVRLLDVSCLLFDTPNADDGRY